MINQLPKLPSPPPSSSLWSALFPLDYNCCCYCVLLLLLPRSARSFAAAATSFLISFAWTSEPNVESSSIFFLAVLFAAVCRCYYSWRCCCYVTDVLQLLYLLDVPSPLTSFMFRVTTCIEQHHHRPSLLLPLLSVVDVLLLPIFSIISIVLLPVRCSCFGKMPMELSSSLLRPSQLFFLIGQRWV